MMRIAIGSDHAGFKYKEMIRQFLNDSGYGVQDHGTYSEEPVDYPLFVLPVAEAVARGETERGIVLGGSGNGEAMAANRIKGVRCALCWNIETARLSRQHNDSNVLSLGQRLVSVSRYVVALSPTHCAERNPRDLLRLRKGDATFLRSEVRLHRARCRQK